MQRLCICNGNFHLDTRLDADGGDLLDDLRWTVQINQTLVDPHLKAIPGFGSFTTGGFSGGDAQSLHRFKTSDFSQGQNKTPKIIIHDWFRIPQIELLPSVDLQLSCLLFNLHTGKYFYTAAGICGNNRQV